MRISIPADRLRAALSRAVKLTPARPRLAAHAGVILHVRGTTLRVVSTDGDSTLSITAGNGTGGRNGQVSIPPKALSSYLNQLPSDTQVVLEFDEETEDLSVTPTGGTTYRFRPMQTSFSLPNALRNDAASVDWDQLDVAVSAIAPSVGEDGAVKVVSDDDSLTLVTTDRYRLGQAVLSGGGFGQWSGLLPLSSLQLAVEAGIDEVTVSSDGKTLRLSGPDTVLTTRVLSVVFPAVGPVFKQVPDPCVKLHTGEVGTILRRMSSVAGEAPVRFEFADDAVELQVTNRTLGSAAERLEVQGLTKTLVAGMSPQYLQQALSAQPGEVADMGWTGPMNPMYLSSSRRGVAVTIVVMPVRL